MAFVGVSPGVLYKVRVKGYKDIIDNVYNTNCL